jgi:hypothetical protein
MNKYTPIHIVCRGGGGVIGGAGTGTLFPNFVNPNGCFSYVHYSYVAIFIRFEIPNGSKFLVVQNQMFDIPNG